MVSSLCSRTRPVSVCPTKVSLPLRLMGDPATGDVQRVLRSHQSQLKKRPIRPNCVRRLPRKGRNLPAATATAFAISHTSHPCTSANQRPRDAMLMGLGLLRTGLLHTRCVTDSDVFQGMNFVTLSGPRARGF
jgi:hypothetical protein